MLEIAPGAVLEAPIELPWTASRGCSSGGLPPASADPRGRALAGRRGLPLLRGGPLLPQRRHRDRARRRGHAGALRPSAREPGGLPRAHAGRPAGARQPLHVAQPGLRRRARAHRPGRAARRRGRRVHPQRPLRRDRNAAPRQPHHDRPRQAPLRQPRALQGRHGRRLPRGLLRQDHRAARRAEDRRDPNQQEPAALARGAGQLDAGSGDLRRRRQVQARLDDRPARRAGAVLPALPRDRRGRRAHAPDPGVRRRRRGAAPGAGGSRGRGRDAGAASGRTV